MISAGRGRRHYASLLLRRPLSEAARLRRRRRLQHPPVIIIAVDTTTTSTACTTNNFQFKAHHSLVVTTPVRHFTPEAYRYKRRDNDNTTTSTTKQQHGNNRKHPKNGLLTSSRRAAAAAADQSKSIRRNNNNNKHHHCRFLTKEQLRALQKECYRLTINYHRTLFGHSSSTDDPQKSYNGGAADLFTIFTKLHEQCTTIISSNNNNTISLQTLYQTEEAFRHICKLLDQCISGIVVVKCKQEEEEESSCSMVAEKLLNGLIQLRKDRARLIRLATTHQTKQQHTEQQTKRSASILSWIRDIFVVSGEQQQQQQDKHQQQLELIAHEDEAFGPSTSTINSVITTVYHEFSDNVLAKVDTDEQQQQDDKVVVVGLSPEQMLDRANRMSRLLETMRQLNLQPRASTLGLVLKAHEAIGTLEAALKAEKLYSYFPEEGAFAPLLYAFRDAALYEQSKSKRGEAAKRAHELVIKREQTVEGGARKVATHYKILLETYANAGSSIVPDVCERAEFLLQRLVGTKAFSSVVNFDPDSPVSVHEFNPALLHSLILIYADSGDKDKIERAMNVLRYMECIRDHRSGRTAKQDHPKPLPDVFTYNALLRALKHHPQRSELDKDLVERMTRNVASWPNQQTFQQVKFDVNDSPEEWLSMLETRRVSLNPTDRDVVQMDTSVYHWALGRLRYKAKDGGGVEAARRGVRLVDSMEAQSGVADLSIGSLSNMSVFEQDVASSVYNEKLRPTVETYNLILAACNFVTVESDKEEAFAIANDIYRRIGERGLSPDKSTFKLYLWCCTNLVESTESRRAKVEEVAKHAIKTKQIPKGLGAVLHQNNLPHLLKELNAEETVSS